jgi:hypothetical protein
VFRAAFARRGKANERTRELHERIFSSSGFSLSLAPFDVCSIIADPRFLPGANRYFLARTSDVSESVRNRREHSGPNRRHHALALNIAPIL